MMTSEVDLTGLLHEISSGRPDLVDELLPHVYSELKVLAHKRLDKEYSSATIATTGLVHEAYLKLVKKPDEVDWKSRGHFFAVASRAMRQVLINRAHARKADKRGGKSSPVDIDSVSVMSEERADELIALDEALEILRAEQPRVAEVVDLRYFGGFNINECAEILDVSESTINRDWRLARLWLYDKIKS